MYPKFFEDKIIINVHKYNKVYILLFIRYFDIGTRTVVFDDHGDCCGGDQYYLHHLFNCVFDRLLQGKECTKWVIISTENWLGLIFGLTPSSNLFHVWKTWPQQWSPVAAKVGTAVGANFFGREWWNTALIFGESANPSFRSNRILAKIFQFKFYTSNKTGELLFNKNIVCNFHELF